MASNVCETESILWEGRRFGRSDSAGKGRAMENPGKLTPYQKPAEPAGSILSAEKIEADVKPKVKMKVKANLEIAYRALRLECHFSQIHKYLTT